MSAPLSNETMANSYPNSLVSAETRSQARFGRTFLKVENVCSSETLLRANQDIDEMPSKPNIINGNQIRRVTIIDENKCPWSQRRYRVVSFGNKCNIKDWSDLENSLCFATENVKKLSKEAIETMASTLEWKDTQIDMTVGLLRYQLSPSRPFVTDLPWHQDSNSLTMTTLISPYNQGATGFSGGELSFARWMTELPSLELIRLFLADKPEHDESTVKTFEYPYNGGFIFDCVESQHKVNDLKLVNPDGLSEYHVERRLLSIFSNPDKDYVRSLSQRFDGKNPA